MSIGFGRIEQVTKEIEERNARRSAQWKQQSSPAPVKPKYEYSTDNLSMLDLAGGAMTGVVSADVSENVVSAVAPFTGAVSTIVETASDTAAYLKGSNAYRKYLATDEEKKREAQVISIETGIPVNALLYSDENMAKGRSVQEYTKKRMALAPEGINDWDDMDAVYAKFPGLKEVVENPNMSDTDVAIAMHNVQDLSVTHDAVEAFTLGLEADKANYRIGEIGMGAFLGLHKLNDEDRAEIERLKKSIPEQKETPNFFDDPLVAIAGGAGGQLYHFGAGVGQGLKTAGAIAGAGVLMAPVTGGASVPVAGSLAVGSVAGSMAYDMFMNSAGRQYYEYSSMKDKNGKQLLTDDEARGFAALSAGLETGVEFWNYGKVMSLFGMNMKREIMEIVAKSQGNQEMLRAGVKRFLGDKMAQAVKVGTAEAIEEGTQDVLADKAVHDAIVTYAPQSRERKYTGEEYAKGFLESSAEALPGIIGLGVLGGTASQIKSVRNFAKLQAMQNENFLGEMKLANGLQMLQALGQNAKQSKLFKKSPEVYEASVKGAVEKTDFKEVRIDTELAMQDEESAVVFNQLVEAMGLEQEEVNAILENKADLVVPTETYVTTVQDNEVLNQYISFDEKGHSMARKKYFAQIAEETAKRMNLQSEAEQAEVIHTVIVSNFPEEGAQQDMGAACILENPSNPYQAWKRMYTDTKTAIDARLGSIVANLKEGMSRGSHVYVSDGIGHEAKRMSDNDAWYGEFYKQHKRKPNERELLDMAREIYGGGGAKYGTAGIGYENLPDEAQADIDALDRDFETLSVLEDIKDKVSQLTASEMTVTKGLSPSGYRVYQSAREQLAQGNKDVQDSARVNAILFARYADRMAENISKITGKEYTAEDYVRERFMLVPNAMQVDERSLNQYDKVDLEVLEAQKNAVREKYRDTAEWMKAPNGKDTNLTEDQWVTVRTKAFKRWFGNWNYDENEKLEVVDITDEKMLDENGKPVDILDTDALGKWVRDNLQGSSVVIDSDGSVVDFYRRGIESGVVKARVSKNKKETERDTTPRTLYAKLSEVIQKSIYFDFEIADARHAEKSYGIEHYYSFLKAGNQFYKVNVILNVHQNFKTSYKGHKVYKIEIEPAVYRGFAKKLDSHARTDSISTISIGKLMQGVKPKESSKIIDENGEPLVLYHQTEAAFNTFDVGREGAGKSDVELPAGIYMKPTQENIGIKGDIQMPLYARIENPITFSDREEVARYLKDNCPNYREKKESLDELDNKYHELYTEADKKDFEVMIEYRTKRKNAKTAEEAEKLKAEEGRYRENNKAKQVLAEWGKQADALRKEIHDMVTNHFKQSPYDGIVLEADRGSFGRKTKTYIAFDNTQVKSATDNSGAFSVDTANIYNQAVRGQTRISGMSRTVSLFEKANKSTFVHEMGHVALADLKLLAEMEGAPAELVRDWQVIKEWLGVKPSQKELTREQHEQFARGFEAYLRSGEAPVRGLKSVFRKFKKWLCDIYADFVQLGGKPSAEVKAVMARMLASEQEIEAEAAMQAVESITRKKGMQFLDDTTQAMYERWVKEAKEEAKEKVLKAAMKDVADNLEEGRQEIIKAMREDIENDFKQKDIFKVEALVKLSGSTDILSTVGYTEEQYKAELETYGGSLEKAVEAELAKAVEEMDSYTDVQKTIEEEAVKALQTSEYKARLVAFELEAIRRKEEAERRLDKSIDKALADIEADLNGEAKDDKKDSKEVKSLKQKIADLKYTYRWKEAEMALINEMQEAERKEERDRLMATIKQFREEAKKSKKGIRLVRDSVVGQTKSYRAAARKQLASMPLAQATATATWQQKERMKGHDADKLLAKGMWEEAKKAKEEQLMFGLFAAESVKIKQEVEKKIRQMKKRSDSIAKGNTKLSANERYFYNHLLYAFGINGRDAVKPLEWDDEKTVGAMFRRYAESNEVSFYDEDGNLDISKFILVTMRSGEVYRKEVQGARKAISALGYRGLTKDEFDEMADVLTTVYTIGKNAFALRTVKDEHGNSVDIEVAAQMIADGIRQNVKIDEVEDTTGMEKKSGYDKYITKGRDLLRNLFKPETFFRRNDGDKDGVSMQFLYNPLKHACDKETKMHAEAAKVIDNLFAGYDQSDWNKKQFKLGTSNVTREQLIVVALNWGTEINRMRVMDGYHVSAKEVEDVLGNLTEADWRLVDGLWNLIGSYWEDTVAVEERVTGVGFVKQKAVPFDIKGKDGTMYHIKGGYYPIMYDPEKSVKAANQQADDMAKQQMSGNVVYGMRRSHTKKRTKEKVERKIYTRLDPFGKALDDVIHNICYREACRDVNKLIHDQAVQGAFIEAYGQNTYLSLEKWVRDNWAQDERKDELSKVTATLRRNMTTAVMSWRVSTALLNVINILPMMEYLGKTRALQAVVETYKDPLGNFKFVCEKSVFIAERVRTMDRDVREKMAGRDENFIDKHAFALLAYTDQMLAVPTWLAEYNRVYREEAAKNIAPELVEQHAIDAGDAAVRRVFGSGDVKDLSAAQRGNEVSKMLTMYYSYMNTVLNALEYRRGRAVDAKQWGKFANAILLWLVLPSAMDAILRDMWSDDDDEWYEKFAKSFLGQVGGMFPLVRDVFRSVTTVMMGDRAYDTKVTSAFDAPIRAVNVAQAIMSDKKDWIDVGRETTRTVGALVGVADTLTDGFWTLIRYADNGDWDDQFGEFLLALIFDKKLESR